MPGSPTPFEPDPDRIRRLADALEREGHVALANLARRVAEELEAERGDRDEPGGDTPGDR